MEVHTRNLVASLKKLDKQIVKDYHMVERLIPRFNNYLREHADHFDRYPEMVSHGLVHVHNMLMLAADFFCPLIDEWSKKYKNRPLPDYQDSDKSKYYPCINAEELMLLFVSIYLHDIGMSDVKKTDRSSARKNHSVYTYELLSPNCMKGEKYHDSNEDLLIGFDDYAREAIALVCKYHQSSWPMTKKEAKEQGKDFKETLEYELCSNKYIIGKCFRGKQYAPTQDDDFSATQYDSEKVNLLLVAAWLRLIDGCDVQISRLGSPQFRKSKVEDLEIRKKLIEEKKKNLQENNIDVFGDVSSTQRMIIDSKHIDSFLVKRVEELQAEIEYLQAQLVAHIKKHQNLARVWMRYESAKYERQAILYNADLKEIKDLVEKSHDNIFSVFYMPSGEFDQSEEHEMCKTFCESVINELTYTFPYLMRDCSHFHAKSGKNIAKVQIVKRQAGKPQKIPIKGKGDLIQLRNQEQAAVAISQKASTLLNDNPERSKLQECLCSIKIICAPLGSGKSAVARQVEKHVISKGIPVCRINGEDYIHFDNDRDSIIPQLFKNISLFFQKNGDYTLFNELSLHVDIEEYHWDKLIELSTKMSSYFIFDDFHKISVAAKNSPSWNFFSSFFRAMVKSRRPVIIFTQKAPSVITLSAEKGTEYSIPFEIIRLPGLKREEIVSLVLNRKIFSERGIPLCTFFGEKTELLIEHVMKYRSLPKVLEILSDTYSMQIRRLPAEPLWKEAPQVLQERVVNQFDQGMKFFVDEHIVKKIKDLEHKKVLQLMLRFTSPVKNAPIKEQIITEYATYDVFGFRNSKVMKTLFERGLLFKIQDRLEEKHIWTLDDWWDNSCLDISSFTFWKTLNKWSTYSWREFLHTRFSEFNDSDLQKVFSSICDDSHIDTFKAMVGYLKDAEKLIIPKIVKDKNGINFEEPDGSLYPMLGEYLVFTSIFLDGSDTVLSSIPEKVIYAARELKNVDSHELRILEHSVISPFNKDCKCLFKDTIRLDDFENIRYVISKFLGNGIKISSNPANALALIFCMSERELFYSALHDVRDSIK